MRNIWRIIKADARSLFTHFFALAVALAIAVLPSLYAWLNIYSNWDPYGNTGNISIAVASLDKGWTEEDGTQVNKGREVVEDLRSSTSINWVIVDTKEEAQQGVYAGDYYAAVVIDEDFSYNMYHMLTEWTDKPTITYYENYKKNAVDTKILSFPSLTILILFFSYLMAAELRPMITWALRTMAIEPEISFSSYLVSLCFLPSRVM